MVEPKLPEHIGHISFYGSLKKALDNSPDLAFTWLRSRMPRQLDSIQKDFNDLYEKARNVDQLSKRCILAFSAWGRLTADDERE